MPWSPSAMSLEDRFSANQVYWKLIGLIKAEHKASGVITRVND